MSEPARSSASEAHDAFQALDRDLLPLSVDSRSSHLARRRRFGIGRPILSQRLGGLCNAEVVAKRRERAVMLYSLTDPPTHALLATIEDVPIVARPRRRRRRVRSCALPAWRLEQAARFTRIGDAP